MNISIKRVYEEPSPEDGTRVLVDRLWPRGLTKEAAKIDRWLKDVAPSNELRAWFGHEPDKWQEFQRRYREELDTNTEGTAQLREVIKTGRVTLVYGAKDELRNNAVLLMDYLEK